MTTHGCISPNVFAPFTNLAVRQAIVSSRHLAFLLQDGRICRVSFRIQTDKIESNTNDSSVAKPRYLPRSQSRSSLQRANLDNPGLPPQITPPGQLDLFSSYTLTRRHQLVRGRGRAGYIFGSRPMVPASNVPDELIEQVRKTFVEVNRWHSNVFICLGSSRSSRQITKSSRTRITTNSKRRKLTPDV